jgi:hypothetical protein
MVQIRRRKNDWEINAVLTKRVFENHWNKQNKSTLYSQKLNQLFTVTLHTIEISPEVSISYQERKYQINTC